MKTAKSTQTMEFPGKWLESMEFGTPMEFRNLCIIPITAPESKTSYIDMNDEEAKQVKVTEIDDSGSVPELKLSNPTEKLLFIIDSEEFIGAKQNRVSNASILVNKKSEVRIPVSCVEEGRWSYKSREFETSKNMMPYKMRFVMMKKVTENLEIGRKHYSDQGEVWNEVRKFHKTAGTDSPTGAMKDSLDNISFDLEQYVELLKSNEDRNGFIAFINGRIAGMEFISRVRSFKNLEEKVIRSLASEAIFNSSEITENTDYKAEIYAFIQNLKKASCGKFKSVELGDDIRIKGESLSGSALVYKDELIHLMVNCN